MRIEYLLKTRDRKHLGEVADTMTDEQIIQHRDALQQIMDQVLDEYFEKSSIK